MREDYSVRIASLAVATLLTACVGQPAATPFGSVEATNSPAATGEPTARATPEPTPDGLRVQFHASRRAVLDILTASGYDCGAEFPLSDGKPAVLCSYAGGAAGEGVVVIGPADDLLAVRMHTDEGDRLADFLFTFTNDEITSWVIDQVGEIAETGIVPVEVSKAFGAATVTFEASEIVGDSTPMIITVQAPGS